jgi:hypothetical protein
MWRLPFRQPPLLFQRLKLILVPKNKAKTGLLMSAEREKRWKKHLQAIDMRGERFDPDKVQDARRRDWERGIV